MSNPQFDEECQKAEAEKTARKKPLSTKEAFAQWWEKHGKPPHGVSTSYSQNFAFQCAFNAGAQHQENVQIAALVDIREAIGDKDGRLMSDEVVQKVIQLQADNACLMQKADMLFNIEESLLDALQHKVMRSDVAAAACPRIAKLEAESTRLRDALEPLVSACEEEFAGPSTDGFDDETSVGGGEDGEMTITFGMIRRCRKALANHIVDANKMVPPDRVVELEEALRLMLPMAKGYAAEHPVGRNREMVIDAENALAGTLVQGDSSNPFQALTTEKCLELADMEGDHNPLAISPDLDGKEGA